MKEFISKLRDAGIRAYRTESDNHKYNAQLNLSGRSHYADDDTLHCFRAKILSTRILCDGGFFYLRESCARDMRNQSRAHRVHVFDVFGDAVPREDDNSLENAARTGCEAEARFCAAWINFDAGAYYRAAIADRIRKTERELAALRDAAATL